jgi:hypothetical protein
MDPSSPQPETSNLPRTPPASPQLDASDLPGTPQVYPQLTIQKPLPKPEKIPSPIHEARNEVSMDIHFCYLHLINHPQFGKPFFSGSGYITTKLFFYCG